MKNRIKLLFSLLLLFPSVLLAAPKIATIDLGKAMSTYQLNKEDIATYEAAEVKLSEDPRKAAVDAMVVKLEELSKKIKETKRGSEDFIRIQQEGFEAKEAHADLLNKWTNYRSAKMRIITEAYIDATKERSDEILKIARDIGEAQGFDWILETGGKTNSRMPVVLYIRNYTDLTDQVIEELSKIAPTPEEEDSAISE